MNHPKKYVPRLSILLFEIVFHNVYQWNIASLVALHNLSTVFRYDNDVVVFVNRNHDI